MSLSLMEARERISKTIEEYIQLDTELRALENTNYRVCIFGSARIQPRNPSYHTVFHLAQGLSERGVDVVTGGGPGLMEAANRGVSAAKRGRSKSYGLPLDLPSLVERPNRHLDIKSAHKRFSSRLDEFIRLSHAVVVAPGGIGTVLELMYVWQLLQLHMLEQRPVILLGREFWGGFLRWMREMPAAQRLMNREDLDHLTVVDSADEALDILARFHEAFKSEHGHRPCQPDTGLQAQVAAELADELSAEVRFTQAVVSDVERMDGLQPAA
jgi:uncharacterized protein (TIGR00730 family)